MREIFWGKRAIDPVDRGSLEIQYYLLVEEIQVGEALFCENYGIKLCTSDVQTEDHIMILGITPNAKKMTALMNLLERYSVTSSTLTDVLDDWLIESV